MTTNAPVRATFLPFARPFTGDEEKTALAEVLDSGWLATGARVKQFEDDLAAYCGAPRCVSLTSATAGLHVALLARGVGPGDEVIVPAMTFAATANVVVHCGAKPVFADVDPRTYNLGAEEFARRITPRTKAVIPVHFTGHPCDLDAIVAVARPKGIAVIEDAAQAIGAGYKGVRIGGRPDTDAVFSFHPNKNITTGEGGAIVTHDAEFADRCTVLRFHGLNKDAWNRFAAGGKARTSLGEAGFKYNLTDLAGALGVVQLKRLPELNARRKVLADRYDEILKGIRGLILPARLPYPHDHPHHLYAPLVEPEVAGMDRDALMERLKAEKIGSGLHYSPPVHLHDYYRREFGGAEGQHPGAEFVGERILSLPLFPGMSEADQDDVAAALEKILGRA